MSIEKIIKSKDTSTVVNVGVTPLSLLGIAFIVLKLTGVITWSWLWVLFPFYVPVLLAMLILLAITIFVLVSAKQEDIIEKVEEIKDSESASSKTEENVAEEAVKEDKPEKEDKPKKEEASIKKTKKRTTKKKKNDGESKEKNA